MKSTIYDRLKSEIHSPFMPFKVFFGLSFILFSVSVLVDKSLVNELAAFALRAAEVSTMIILSLFLVVQKKFNKSGGLQVIGAAIFCLTISILLSMLQYVSHPFEWENTIGSLCAAIILNMGRFYPDFDQTRFIQRYTLSLTVIGILIALTQYLFQDQISRPYTDEGFTGTFKIINIFTGLLMLAGCRYSLRTYPKKTDPLITPLVYYFIFISVTRFFVIDAERPQLTWWIICIMRYGTTLIAISYLVSAYHESLRMIQERNLELMSEARKNEEKKKIIEEQRVKILHSAQMASIAKLSGLMAHEINNPITSISLNTEFLLKRSKGSLTEDQAARIKKIYALTCRITDIIRRFLTLSQLQESSQTEYADLHDIVKNTVQFCGTASQNNIDFKIDSIPHVVFLCSPSHISQALLNVLFNSFEAVKNSDEKWVHLSFETTPDEVIIKVTDSGKGIPSQMVDKIMDPFFTTKDVNEGIGLGLSISKTYIEEHKGRLYVNAASPYTQFVMELPIEPTENLSLH